jgi:hypothetical protein
MSSKHKEIAKMRSVRLVPRCAWRCLVATVWWRQRATWAIAAWQTFMYLKSSILHRFNRHTSSFLPSHRKSLTRRHSRGPSSTVDFPLRSVVSVTEVNLARLPRGPRGRGPGGVVTVERLNEHSLEDCLGRQRAIAIYIIGDTIGGWDCLGFNSDLEGAGKGGSGVR